MRFVFAHSASTASHRAFVTIAIRPSCRVGWRNEALIWVGTKGEYFTAEDWTAQITLIRQPNSASARKGALLSFGGVRGTNPERRRMNAASARGDQSTMTENCQPAKCPDSRDTARAWLLDTLAVAIGLGAVFHYQPDGMIAGIIIFVGAYTLASVLQGVSWVSLAAISQFLLISSAPAIHLATVATAKAGFTGLVFTFLLPGIAQAYWTWKVWSTTGTLSHPLAMACAAWLVVLAIWIVAKVMLANRRERPSN
jgi:hypothetical protein